MHFLEEHPISRHQLPKQEASSLYARFIGAYQYCSEPREGKLTRLTWPFETAVSPKVLKAPVLYRAQPLYVIMEVDPEIIIYVTDWSTAESFFREEHVQHDYYLVDDSLDWCLAVSHDDFFYLIDPMRLFGEFAKPMR